MTIAAVYGPTAPRRASRLTAGRSLVSSEQSAAHRDRQQPHQACKAERAKHGRPAEILDAANVFVLFAGDVIGEFLKPGVEESTPRMKSTAPIIAANQAALGPEKTQRYSDNQEHQFVAQGGLGGKAVAKPRSELKVALKSRLKGDPANRAFGKTSMTNPADCMLRICEWRADVAGKGPPL